MVGHMAKSITCQQLSWNPSRPIFNETLPIEWSSCHRRLWPQTSCLQRMTAECRCVWTGVVSMKPKLSTDTISQGSWRGSTDCEEPGSRPNLSSGSHIPLCESHKATSTNLCSILGMGSPSTVSCRSVWPMDQLVSKAISTIAYGSTMTTALYATVMIL